MPELALGDRGADDLMATQRWMLGAIAGDRLPVGAEVAGAEAAGVVAGSPALSANARVELYRRGYRARLVACLRETHPGLRHALGNEVFDAFALDYLAAHPSRSPTLTQLGASWPQHLQDTRPDLGADRREAWPDFLIDLAHLEQLFLQVYDGPGVEGQRLLCAGDLPGQPQPDATVQTVACLQLLRTHFPVAAYLEAVRCGDDPPLLAPRACGVVVTRQDWVVRFATLGLAEHAALGALMGGASVGAAAHGARLTTQQLWGALRSWADHGYLHAIVAAQRRQPALSTSEGIA